MLAALTMVLMMTLGLFADGFSIVSHAESQGKVTAASANIRKEPSSSSTIIGSTEKDKVISIRGQVQGSDGYTWYQTFVDSETLGYIRSDLVSITDGTTPPAVDATSNTAPAENTTTPATTGNANETPADVTAVNPVSATVSGGASVRVRSNASTTSQIVTTVSNGLALTVTGTANGADGKVWYQVSFSANGSEVQGFIRSDYVTLSGELTPYTEEPVEDPTTDPEVPVEDPEPEVVKDYDTTQIDGTWYLIDNTKGEQHDIQGLFDKVTNNAAAYEEANKTAKTEKVIIIILVLLLVGAAAAVALLIFRIKDMTDDAYFSQVEKETIKSRGERPRAGSQKVMHTVGTEKPAGARTGAPQGTRQGQRPAGTRPAGAGQAQRPAGTRPAGTSQGTGQAQRPTGTRPAGASQGTAQTQRPAGARPAGTSQGTAQTQRPAGARPAGTSQGTAQTQRPAGARPAGTGQGMPQGQRPTGARPAGTGQRTAQAQTGGQQGWQSKNFMADDDDEFEFEFLNYDGDDEQ